MRLEMCGSCKRGLSWSQRELCSWGGPVEMSCIKARGLYNTNIYQSLDTGSPKGGNKLGESGPPSEVRSFLGRYPLWAASTQHWENQLRKSVGPWTQKHSGRAPQPPHRCENHCQQVIPWINKVFLFLHGNLGSCINDNVAKSPESPFNTEAFICALHFLEPIWFSHFRPFHQMDVLAWWQVQKGAWSKRATVPEVKTHFAQMWKICHPYGLHQKTIN